jgi:hypothetical protein
MMRTSWASAALLPSTRAAARVAKAAGRVGKRFIVISCLLVVTRAASTGEILKTAVDLVCGACVRVL